VNHRRHSPLHPRPAATPCSKGLAAARDGDGSGLVVLLASIRCSVWGHSDPHAGRIDIHIAPDVGATSFDSPPVANRAHRRSNLGRSAKRSQSRRNYKAGCWQGVFREHIRSLPNISGLTGRLRGRARRLLGRGPTAPRLAAPVHQRKPCHSRALPGNPRAFFAS